MTASYNVALLRNLWPAVEGGLKNLRERLVSGEYRTGNRTDNAVSARSPAPATSPAETPLRNLAHQIHTGLEMVKCHAVIRIAATLDETVTGLFEADRRGWNAIRSNQVAQLAVRLTDGLMRQIHHMVNGEATQPVVLWPLWSALNEHIGRARGEPADLFEPEPRFVDAHFQSLDPDYLLDVVGGADQRLEDELAKWGGAADAAHAERSARRSLEVFDMLFSLRHRRAYQVYWLVWRARLTLGLLGGGQALWNQRATWVEELGEVLVEIRKFGKGTREPVHDRLMSALRPVLVSPWNEAWGVGHPVLAELNSCLNLSAFWLSAASVNTPEQQQAAAEFEQNRGSLNQAVRDFIATARRLFDNESSSAVKAMIQAGMSVLSKEEWVPDRNLAPLFGAVRQLVTHASSANSGPPNHEAAIEMAGMFLMLEEMLGRPFPVSPSVVERIELQTLRLEAAWAGRLGSLRSLEPARWDEDYGNQQRLQARRAALGVFLRDLKKIEERWAEASRGDPAADEAAGDAGKVLELGGGVLRMLRYPAGALLATALTSCLTAGQVSRLHESDRKRFVEGLTALSAYVERLIQGDGRASQRLEGAVSWVGEELHHAIAAENEDEAVAEDPENDALIPEPSDSAKGVVSAGNEVSADDRGSDPGSVDDTDGWFDDGNILPLPDSTPDGAVPPSGAWERGDSDFGARADRVQPDEMQCDETERGPDSPVGASLPETETSRPIAVPAVKPDWLRRPLPPLPASGDLREVLEDEGVVDRPGNAEIARCFVDEAGDVLARLPETRGRLREQPDDPDAWADLRRAYHTLKGSGRMAGYVGLGEVAFWAEQSLSERIARGLPFDDSCERVLADLDAHLSSWIGELRVHTRSLIQSGGLATALRSLSGGDAGLAPDPGDPDVADSMESAPAAELERLGAEGESGLADPGFDGERAEDEDLGEESEEEEEAWQEAFDALQNLVREAQRLGGALVRVRNARGRA